MNVATRQTLDERMKNAESMLWGQEIQAAEARAKRAEQAERVANETMTRMLDRMLIQMAKLKSENVGLKTQLRAALRKKPKTPKRRK